MRLGYKIVNAQGDKYMSSSVFSSKARVEYVVGKGVRPKKGNGPLMVCKTLEVAKGIVLADFQKIFLCAYRKSSKKCVWIMGEFDTKFEGFKNMTEDEKEKYSFAGEVMLIEEVKC